MGLVNKGEGALEKLRRQKDIHEKIENGTLTVVGAQESLVLVIDGSASMGCPADMGARYGASRWQAAVQACGELMKDSIMSSLGVVVFDDTIIGSCPIGTPVNDNEALLASVGPRHGTCFTIALRQAKVLHDAEAPRSVRRIVLLSDGEDGMHAGSASFERVMQELVEAKIVVDTVGFGSDPDEVRLRMIAERTGGVYRHARDAKALVREFKRLEAGIRGLLAGGA